MAQIDIDKFVISLMRYFGNNKGIATTLDRCLFSLGLKYVDTPTGGRLERVDQPTMLEKIMWDSGERKPAEWSEEDEKHIHSIISTIECNRETYKQSKVITDSYTSDLEWFKSLINRCKLSDDLPHWKKSTLPNDLPNDDTTGFNSDFFCHRGYHINYKELFEKLPKED